MHTICHLHIKGKVQPRTGHEGPEGEWKYSSTLALTSALDGGGWLKPRPGRFIPGNDPVPIIYTIIIMLKQWNSYIFGTF